MPLGMLLLHWAVPCCLLLPRLRLALLMCKLLLLLLLRMVLLVVGGAPGDRVPTSSESPATAENELSRCCSAVALGEALAWPTAVAVRGARVLGIQPPFPALLQSRASISILIA